MAVVKRDAQVLHDKAISSITVATSAFNSPSDTGRVTQVLLSLQHAFEMLLKAALVQHNVKVFDKKTGRSNGFSTCLGQAQGHAVIKVSADDAGTLRTIDQMRDDEQHWFNDVPEQFLYRYTMAGITIFNELLDRVFGERLAAFLPNRVLPVSTDAPKDLHLLLDEQYSQIAKLLKPGRRMQEQAKAQIRTLLAMEAHQDPNAEVSDKDVARVVKGIRAGKSRADVFPKLEGLGTEISGNGVNVTVHFSKKGEGLPVRYVSDDSEDAAAIREVDLSARFNRSATELAGALKITMPVATALRDHLAIDKDPTCYKDFSFGQSSHRNYSDKAFAQMRDVIKAGNAETIRRAHNPREGQRHRRCSIAGCRAGQDPAPA